MKDHSWLALLAIVIIVCVIHAAARDPAGESGAHEPTPPACATPVDVEDAVAPLRDCGRVLAQCAENNKQLARLLTACLD